ncbi:glycoside hydrolase family 43 protein [Dactylosporangium matsuzakiense]|uniref:Glycoside hydrolase n=1 Tax=Dactylosporangium matsuzakiense TaxID=53360 RepID=A0A9W6NLR3_9ACTN|nr:glycoside hydrolase family 43 protein [Dactylosporangium matsuzakiense]UWZ48763.1 family 43 glycosylhydrolase [Dactylosporangium matsuzakiense]GLL01137.1 glycoside hydrolase [Dactylosporangium matsuzakiense]
MRRALLALTVLLSACSGEPGRPDPTYTGPTYTNPVYTGDAPDPQAVRVGSTWYLVHTNAGGRNVPVLTSPDLVHWTAAGDALPALPAWADGGRTWAPEIIELAPDRYVLYVTVADRASGRQCIATAVAPRPEGPYRADSPGPLVCQADEGGSIDASPFKDGDSQLYLLWKNDGNATGRDTWLWSQRLAPDGLSLLGVPARLIRQSEPWEGRVVEAPFMWRRPGDPGRAGETPPAGARLLLFYAANAYDTADYAEGYAVCDAPLGPCRKPPGNPLLASRGPASGPGHASMVEVNGRTWLLYHAWPRGAEGSTSPGRQLWLDEVTWDGDTPQVRGPSASARPVP